MITLHSIDFENNGKKLVFDYSFDASFSKYFNESEPLYVEYDSDVRAVPESVLVVPFLSNVLPIRLVPGSGCERGRRRCRFCESG